MENAGVQINVRHEQMGQLPHSNSVNTQDEEYLALPGITSVEERTLLVSGENPLLGFRMKRGVHRKRREGILFIRRSVPTLCRPIQRRAAHVEYELHPRR